jgi:hypothetical protein
MSGDFFSGGFHLASMFGRGNGGFCGTMPFSNSTHHSFRIDFLGDVELVAAARQS